MLNFLVALAQLAHPSVSHAEEAHCLPTATLAASAFEQAYTEGQMLREVPKESHVVVMSNLHVSLKSSKPVAFGGVLETYLVQQENTHTRDYATVKVIYYKANGELCALKSVEKID